MSDPAPVLQDWIIETLRGETEAGARVYDEVPPAAARKSATGRAEPYIALGPSQVLIVSGDAACGRVYECFRQIDVWSAEAVGYPEVLAIAGQAALLLDDARPSFGGFAALLVQVQSVQAMRAADNLMKHAVISLRALVQDATT